LIELLPFTRVNYRVGIPLDFYRNLTAQVSRAEIETVRDGLRPCATVQLTPSTFAWDLRVLLDFGLVFLPIRECRCYSGFAHRFYPPEPGQPSAVFGAVSRERDLAEEFKRAFEEHDDRRMGELLGYPECDIQFFCENFGKDPDPLYLIGENTEGAELDGDVLRVPAYPQNNILLRYMGLRVIPHFPCSYLCKASLEFSEKFLRYIDRSILEILGRETLWDRMKGVVVVENEFLRIVAGSPSGSRQVMLLGCEG